MAFYVRFFNEEALLSNEEEIIPYLDSLNMLSQKEMETVQAYLNKLKSGTNRIFLDQKKKKYILAIGTDKTDIAEFQKNAKKEARPNHANQHKSSADPLPESKPMPEYAPEEPFGEIDPDAIIPGWMYYSLLYTLNTPEGDVPYTFKAKIKDVSLFQAYDQMCIFLDEKHGQDCFLPDFYPEVLQVEPVEE